MDLGHASGVPGRSVLGVAVPLTGVDGSLGAKAGAVTRSCVPLPDPDAGVGEGAFEVDIGVRCYSIHVCGVVSLVLVECDDYYFAFDAF